MVMSAPKETGVRWILRIHRRRTGEAVTAAASLNRAPQPRERAAQTWNSTGVVTPLVT